MATQRLKVKECEQLEWTLKKKKTTHTKNLCSPIKQTRF